MITYKTILAAIDTSEEANEVLLRAHKMAELHGAQLHVMTVIRPLSFTYSGFESTGMSQAMVNFETDVNARTKEALEKIAIPLGITKEQMHVELGRPADEIKTKAENLQAGLIVLGSHGRHGLGLVLGSTSNGVLHGTTCDVLTVRIHSKD